MMFITHISLGLLLGLIIVKSTALPVSQSLFIGAIILGSLFPDIDSATSFIGKRMKLVSLFFKHRGAIHSLPVMAACTMLFFIITGNAYYTMAFLLGYLSHLLIDSLTPMGVAWMWPSKKRIRGALRTTGIFDFLLLLFFTALDLALIVA
ncbi:metal-dependent hydrolase [Candidatus Woesearchaeota archaeon]|nr:metal-dependent hydrolase [Candidatus Woesearchaeota archaeon]